MPRVPVLQEQTAIGSLPAFRQSAAGATPEAFGAGVGRAIAGAGAQMVEVANRFQEEQNVLAAKNAYLTAKGKEMELFRELQAKKGQEAVDFGKEMVKGLGQGTSAWDKIRTEAIKGLNANQRQKFDTHWAPQQLASVDATGRYMTQQFGVAKDSQDQAALDLAAQDYAATLHVEALNEGKAAILSMLKRKGASPDEIKVAQEKWVTAQYAGKVGNYISKGMIAQAEEFYRQHVDEIPATEHETFNTALERARKSYDIQRENQKAKQMKALNDDAMSAVLQYEQELIAGNEDAFWDTRFKATQAIEAYREMGEALGMSVSSSADSMLKSVMANEKHYDAQKAANADALDRKRAREQKAKLDTVDAVADEIIANMKAGIITPEEAFQQGLTIAPEAGMETRGKLNRAIVTARDKAKMPKEFDNTKLVQQLSSEAQNLFIGRHRGAKTVKDLSTQERVYLGILQDSIEKYAETHPAGDVDEYARKAFKPLQDKQDLSVYGRLFTVREDRPTSDVPLQPWEEAKMENRILEERVRRLNMQAPEYVPPEERPANAPRRQPGEFIVPSGM